MVSYHYLSPYDLSAGIYFGAPTETAHGNRSSQNITRYVLTGVVALNEFATISNKRQLAISPYGTPGHSN